MFVIARSAGLKSRLQYGEIENVLFKINGITPNGYPWHRANGFFIGPTHIALNQIIRTHRLTVRTPVRIVSEIIQFLAVQKRIVMRFKRRAMLLIAMPLMIAVRFAAQNHRFLRLKIHKL